MYFIITIFLMFTVINAQATTIDEVPDDVLALAFEYVNLEDIDSLRLTQKRFKKPKFDQVLSVKKNNLNCLSRDFSTQEVAAYLQRYDYASNKFTKITALGTQLLLSDLPVADKMTEIKKFMPFIHALLPYSPEAKETLRVYIAVAEDLAVKGSHEAMEFLTTVNSPDHMLLIANKYMGRPISEEDQSDIKDQNRARQLYRHVVAMLDEDYQQPDNEYLAFALSYCNQLKMYSTAVQLFNFLLRDERQMLYYEDAEQGIIANLHCGNFAEARRWVNFLINDHANIENLNQYNFLTLAGIGLKNFYEKQDFSKHARELEEARLAYAALGDRATDQDQMKYVEILVALKKYDEAASFVFKLFNQKHYTGEFLMAAGIALFKKGQYSGNFEALRWVLKQSDTVYLSREQDIYMAIFAAYTGDWALCEKHLEMVKVYAELEYLENQIYLAYIYSMNPDWQDRVPEILGDIVFETETQRKRINFLHEIDLPVRLFTTRNWILPFFYHLQQITCAPQQKDRIVKSKEANLHINKLKAFIDKHPIGSVEGLETPLLDFVHTCLCSFDMFASEDAFNIILNHGNLEKLYSLLNRLSKRGMGLYPWALKIEQKIQERLGFSCLIEGNPSKVRDDREQAINQILSNMKEHSVTFGATIVAQYGAVNQKLDAADMMFDLYKNNIKENELYLATACLLYNSAYEEIKRHQEIAIEALTVICEEKEALSKVEFPYMPDKLERMLREAIMRSTEVIITRETFLKQNSSTDLKKPNPLMDQHYGANIFLHKLPEEEVYEFESTVKASLNAMTGEQLRRAAYSAYTMDVNSILPYKIWKEAFMGYNQQYSKEKEDFINWMTKCLH